MAHLLARLVVKLQFAASAIALFQRSLAHARYAAAPVAVAADPPIVETIPRLS